MHRRQPPTSRSESATDRGVLAAAHHRAPPPVSTTGLPAPVLVPTLVLVLALVLAGIACQQASEEIAPAPRSGEVASVDGVPIHYTVTGSGPTAVVLVHCWSCDSSYWNAQLPALADRHTVVAIDLAGHGHSGAGRDAWTIAAFAADVAAVVTELDLQRVVLVGHSMGGPVVVEAARRLPGRVIGLIGIDNFQNADTAYTDEQISGFMAAFRADFPRTAAGFVGTMFPATVDSAVAAAIIEDIAAAPPEVAVPALEATARWQSQAAGTALDAIDLPFRCISSDRVPTDLEAMRRHVPGFDVTLMPGVGHFPMRERPEAFTRLLLETVAAVEGEARTSHGSEG